MFSNCCSEDNFTKEKMSVLRTPAHKVTARWPPVTDGAFLPVFLDFSEHEEVGMIFACMLMWNRNVMGETAWAWNITNLYCIENYDRLLFQVSIKLSRDFDWPRASLTKPLYMKVKATDFNGTWNTRSVHGWNGKPNVLKKKKKTSVVKNLVLDS